MSGQQITFKPQDIAGGKEITFAASDLAGDAPPTQPAPVVSTHPMARLGDMVTQGGIGAAKGAGRTVVGLGRLFAQLPVLQQLAEMVQPGAFATPGAAESALGLDPTNTAQKVGMTAEQVGEFFVPAGPVGRLVKGAGIVPRMLAEGASAFGVAKAQGDPSAALTGALGVAGPVVGKGVGKVAQVASEKLKTSAVGDVLHALNPTTRRMKAKAERIAPEVIERKITGSLDDVKTTAKAERQSAGENVDLALMRNADQPVDIGSVRDELANLRNKTQNLVQRPDGTSKVVVHDKRTAAQLDNLESLLNEYGDTMTTEQAVAVRRTWDDIVAKAGGYDEKASGAFGVTLDDASEAGVVRPLAGALRKELAKANPDVAVLNKEFRFWKDLETVSSATQTRRVGQRRDLTTKIIRGGAMAAGAAAAPGATVGKVAGGLLAGETAARAEQLFASPKFKLLSAREKTRLAEALASGNKERAGSAIGRALAAINAQRPAMAGG